MKKLVILTTITLLMFCAGNVQAEIRTLTITWAYTEVLTEGGGFRFYKNGVFIPGGEVTNVNARITTLTVDLCDDCIEIFTITAFNATNESVFSAEYLLDVNNQAASTAPIGHDWVVGAEDVSVVYNNDWNRNVFQFDSEARFTSENFYETENKVVKMVHNFGNYKLIFDMMSTGGRRLIIVEPLDYNIGIDSGDPRYISIGMGNYTADGNWNTLIFDLEAKLQEFYPNETIDTIYKYHLEPSYGGQIREFQLLPDSKNFIETGNSMIYWSGLENSSLSRVDGKIELTSTNGESARFSVANYDLMDLNINQGNFGFKIATESFFFAQAVIMTDVGLRVIQFSPDRTHLGDIDGTYIGVALYGHIIDGVERSFQFNFQDLLDYHQTGTQFEKLVKVHFWTCNTITVDDIFSDETDSTEIIYADGLSNEISAQGWSSTAGYADLIFDVGRNTEAIQLIGDNDNSMFILQNVDGSEINVENRPIAQWSVKTPNPTSTYFRVEVEDEFGNPDTRYLIYQMTDADPYITGIYVVYGIGTDRMSGGWRSIDRNLQADLDALETGQTITNILRFQVKTRNAVIEHISFREQF